MKKDEQYRTKNPPSGSHWFPLFEAADTETLHGSFASGDQHLVVSRASFLQGRLERSIEELF